MKRLLKKLIHLIASDRVVASIQHIYPPNETIQRTEIFYFSKIKTCSTFFIIGLLVVLIVGRTKAVSSISEGKIKRNGYDGSTKELTLYLEDEENLRNRLINDREENARKASASAFKVEISEKRYSDDEILEKSKAFKKIFYREILGENKSLDYVDNDMNFIHKVEGYPFSISYRTDKPMILSGDGIINQNKLSELDTCREGVEIQVIATIKYYDYSEEICFFVCVYEKKISPDEEFTKTIEDLLRYENEKSINSDYYYLPESVNGTKIRFYEKKDNTVVILLGLVIIVTLILFFMMDRELEDKSKERTNELLLEYPKLVNKFALFLNAGLPVKKVWFGICKRYTENKSETGVRSALYEEMVLAMNQIQNGMGELEAYEKFADRIGIAKYSVFVNLLRQEISIGKCDLKEQLKIQSREAFAERKNNAKRLYEEASTKLLIPMFMMLFVVIIIIMFPAFSAFKM